MISKYIKISLILLLVAGTSCRKYVEVEQYSERTLKYTSDYQYLLNNTGTFEKDPGNLLLSADDINLDQNPNLHNLLTNELGNIYTWAADYYTADQSDADWNFLYDQIYNCNVIIAGVMGSQNGTDAEKKKVYAEAQAQRAYVYLTLMNIYAPVYNEASAAKDLGVPMLLTPDLFANLTRPSVQAVYDQIIKDLTEAIPVLPDQPSNNIHPAKAAAYATLARTYLYMQRYSEASENALHSLEYQSTLLDLAVYAANPASYPRRFLNPEVILAKQSLPTSGYLSLPLSDKLLGKFTATDLRYTLYMRAGTSFSPSYTGRGSYRHRLFSGDNITMGISVGEMMLTAAEGLARANDITAAMEWVNKLRQKRFKAADYVALSAATAEEATRVVLDERRRELFGMGIRWYDQRRLSKDPVFAESDSRTFKGTTYTLSGNRYVYPICPKNIVMNPEIKQNER